MKRIGHSRFKIAAALVCMSLVSSACGAGSNKRGYEVITDMKYSPAYSAFEENPVTKDGKTSQMPVKGTIPRGVTPYPYDAQTPENLQQAALTLKNPFPKSDEVMARGKHLYATYCTVCHGETGDGQGPITKTGKYPPPPGFATDYMCKLSEGHIYHVVTKGNLGNLMPSYASQILPDDRWKLIRYIQSDIQKCP